MKQFKTLIINEWNTHRRTLLAPMWMLVGVYGITLLGIIIGYIKGGANASINLPPTPWIDTFLYEGTIIFASILGIVSIWAAIIAVDGMINGAFKRKCEILHHSQPVSLPKIMAAKFVLLAFGSMLLYMLLSLFNTLVVGIFMYFWSSAHLYYAIMAWLQTGMGVFLSLLFVSSFFWLCACIFKRKSFFLGLLSILGLEITITILKQTAHLKIPSLIGYLLKLINIRPATSMAPFFKPTLNNTVSMYWQGFYSWDTVVKLVCTIVFLIAGYWIYSRRELT